MFIVDSKGNCRRVPDDPEPYEAAILELLAQARKPKSEPDRFPWGKFAVIVCLLCVIAGAVGVFVHNWDSHAPQGDPEMHENHVHFMPVHVPFDGLVKPPVTGLKPIRPPLVKPVAPTFRPPVIRVR
jgi:hypothetical protein